MQKIIVLENIRSAYNVGAIFRTADGAGVEKVYLVGYTPTPIDRFGRRQSEIEKTSLGAAREITWEPVESTADVFRQIRREGVSIVAVEQDDRSVMLPDFRPTDRVAYIFGNEIAGVSPLAREQADTIVAIPMLGQKESLNVSVAAGIMLYHGINT